MLFFLKEALVCRIDDHLSKWALFELVCQYLPHVFLSASFITYLMLVIYSDLLTNQVKNEY